MLTHTDPFSLALQAHRSGDLARAEHLYRQNLASNPQHAPSWHLLGVLATHRGRPQEALEHIGRAMSLQPDDAAFHLNYGVALMAVGRRAEAIASFREALRLQPDFPHAHNNLANALHEMGDRAQARGHWHKAIELQPDYAEAHHNLAQALVDDGQYDDALRHAGQAVRLAPNHGPAHRVLGNAHAGKEDWTAAETSLRQALRLRPEWPEAHCDLAHVLQKQEKFAEAAGHLRQALQLNPNYAPAHNEFGILRGKEGQPAEAILHFEQALRLRPDYAEAHHNLGVVLKMQRRFDEAVAHFREVLWASPGAVEPTSSLAATLDQLGRTDEAIGVLAGALAERPQEAGLQAGLGTALANAGRVSEAIERFRDSLRIRGDAVVHSCLLDALNYEPNVGGEELLEEHRRWDEAFGDDVLGLAASPGRCNAGEPLALRGRLRIGYVSGDFVSHIAAHFIEPILRHHDPEKVEVFCYADVAAPDARTARLWSLAPQWRPICGLGDADAARLVRSDGIDILVDLAGHTGSRLGVFARKPAAVQVTYLGYPNTTGLSAIDYRLTDAIADPPGEPPCHTEELVRLPGGFCCYAPSEAAPEVSALPAAKSGFVTFGSLHKLAKLNDRVLDLWARVLQAVPSSRLLLFRDNLRGSIRDGLRQRFVERGIDPARLAFPDAVPGMNYLTVYHAIDIALDVFPWSGHATACEGLWMGVPALTLSGKRHAARMVSSVLTQLDMADWIARDREEYVAKARSWAGKIDERLALRSGLRERMRQSPLCDGKRFTAELETAYRALWERSRQGR
jgi:protein O-GlcNAc transferase